MRRRWDLAASRVVTVPLGPGARWSPPGETPPVPPGTCSRSARSSRARRPSCSWPRMSARERRACGRRSCWRATARCGARSRTRTPPCSGGFPTSSSRRCTPAPWRWCAPPRTRASGSPRSRRWPRARPSWWPDLPVFRETLGDAALRFPSGDADGLAAALLRIEREPELRTRLTEAGTAAVARLSWRRAAEDTRAVLAEAAGPAMSAPGRHQRPGRRPARDRRRRARRARADPPSAPRPSGALPGDHAAPAAGARRRVTPGSSSRSRCSRAGARCCSRRRTCRRCSARRAW